MLFKSIRKSAVAIDLGSSNSIIVQGDKLISEATVVAYSGKKRKKIIIGDEAYNMIGREHGDIELIRPVKSGAIADFHAAKHFLKEFSRKHVKSLRSRTSVLTSIPGYLSGIEKKAVTEAFLSAGFYEVSVVYNTAAVLAGCKGDILEPKGKLVVLSGGGSTELSMMSMGRNVSYRYTKLGGEHISEKLADEIRNAYHVSVGYRSVERLKREYAERGNSENLEISGLDTLGGLPKTVTVDRTLIDDIYANYFHLILELARQLISDCPPELIKDIFDSGILLCGGTSLTPKLQTELMNALSVPVETAENPTEICARGLYELVKKREVLEKIKLISKKNSR